MGGLRYEESYLGKLREKIGDMTVFAIAARGIVQDSAGRVLFIRRRDNGEWAMPAGSIELGETISECLVREVREETGLEVRSAELMGVYSDPRFSSPTAYGDVYQLFNLTFVVREWEGELVQETDETIDARFYGPGEYPDLPARYVELLDDFHRFNGRVVVK